MLEVNITALAQESSHTIADHQRGALASCHKSNVITIFGNSTVATFIEKHMIIFLY